jgi:phytoene dehydrogenase-like protein
MMYLGVDGEFDLPHHTIHIAENYEQNLDEIENQHVLSAEPSFYVQNACVTDPTLAPKGHSALYVLAPVTQQHPNVDWSREREGFRRRLLQQMKKAGYELDEPRSVTSASSRRPNGITRTRFIVARPSISPTASIRCCTSARTTVSRISMACISSAAGRIPAAACR